MERKLKDSGIPWIGEIPEHWDVMRLRRVFSEAHEKTTDEEGQLLTLSQYTGISPKSEGKRVGMFEAESTVGYNIVHVGQFVMNIMLAWNGSYGVSDFEGIISPAYVVFNFNFRCCKKYFHYLLRLDGYPPAFKTVSRGIIESRLRLYPIYFYQFLTIVPPLAEQEAIAAYLDAKCGEIDELIEVEQQMISDLESYRQSVITEAVTHGLNPSENNTDSGVYWIGYVPSKWHIAKMKYFITITNGSDPKTEGDVPVYGSGASSFKTCGEFKEGPTVLIGRKGATLHIPHYIEGRYWNVDTAFDTRVNNFNLRYFYYLASSLDYRAYISATTLPSMTQSNYENMLIPVPPLAEQQEIAEYLDTKCSEIDELIKVKQEKIETLKQYRQSLIFEAVTGKTPIIENL